MIHHPFLCDQNGREQTIRPPPIFNFSSVNNFLFFHFLDKQSYHCSLPSPCNMTKKNKQSSPATSKPKITKAERKEKYTRLARERSAQQALRRRGQSLVCFHCRERGHAVEHCPNVTAGKNKGPRGAGRPKICYKCGSTEHGLGACPQRNEGDANDLPFASCFVCGEKGHLASGCSKNEKGIYINGGECKTCGSKQHLSKDCPKRAEGEQKKADSDSDEDSQQFADLLEGEGDDNVAEKGTTSESERPLETKAPKPKRRVVKF